MKPQAAYLAIHFPEFFLDPWKQKKKKLQKENYFNLMMLWFQYTFEHGSEV